MEVFMSIYCLESGFDRVTQLRYKGADQSSFSLLNLTFPFWLGLVIRENQKFELLGIWREQWIKKLRLCALVFHSNMHVFLLYRLELCFLLVGFSFWD